MSSTKNINRITLFKIPDLSSQEKLVAIYKNLQQNAQKVFLALPPPVNHSLTVRRTQALHPIHMRRAHLPGPARSWQYRSRILGRRF